MSASITKVQEVFQDDPNIVGAEPTVRRAMGLMDNGIFGIAHSPSYVENPGTSYAYDVESDFVAFHVTNSDLAKALGDDTYLHDFGLVGATWSGDALGIARSSETAVFGPALLTITGESDPRERSDYVIRLNVDWTNGDSIQIGGWAGGSDDLGLPVRLFGGGVVDANTNEITHVLHGHFAGTGAEEAFGSFKTPKYVGSFGATRQ